MYVELIDADDSGARPAPRNTPTGSRTWMRRVGLAGAGLGFLAVGYFAGSTGGRQPNADATVTQLTPTPTAASVAPLETDPAFLVTTTSGLTVLLQPGLLNLPGTEGATNVCEAAELWGAYVTSELTPAEHELLRESPPGLQIHLDPSTQKYTSVTLGAH